MVNKPYARRTRVGKWACPYAMNACGIISTDPPHVASFRCLRRERRRWLVKTTGSGGVSSRCRRIVCWRRSGSRRTYAPATEWPTFNSTRYFAPLRERAASSQFLIITTRGAGPPGDRRYMRKLLPSCEMSY